MMPIQIKTYN